MSYQEYVNPNYRGGYRGGYRGTNYRGTNYRGTNYRGTNYRGNNYRGRGGGFYNPQQFAYNEDFNYDYSQRRGAFYNPSDITNPPPPPLVNQETEKDLEIKRLKEENLRMKKGYRELQRDNKRLLEGVQDTAEAAREQISKIARTSLKSRRSDSRSRSTSPH